MTKAFLTLLPTVAVIAALVFRSRPAVRFVGVAVIVLTGFAISGGLIAPHRLAEDLLHGYPQSDQWRQGASDTRDAVYGVLPPLASAFVALVILALIPSRADNVKGELDGPANGNQPIRAERNSASPAAGSRR
jgi:hypothetical protein